MIKSNGFLVTSTIRGAFIAVFGALFTLGIFCACLFALFQLSNSAIVRNSINIAEKQPNLTTSAIGQIVYSHVCDTNRVQACTTRLLDEKGATLVDLPSIIADREESFLISSKYPISVFNERVWLLVRVTPKLSALKAELFASLLFAVIPILLFYLIQVAANKRGLEIQLEAAGLREKLLERDAQLAKLSSQVAHDIRSPVSVLNLVVSSLDEISRDKIELINKAVGRINEIANDLLFKPVTLSSDGEFQSLTDQTDISVEQLVDAIIREKQVEFRSASSLKFLVNLNRSESSFSSLPTAKLSRVISNLINNAVDALEGQPGIVKLSVTSKSDAGTVVLTVEDDGVGIPEETLAKFNQREFSSSKSMGSGLGLKDAFEAVEKVGGEIKMTSVVGKGTSVSLTLPLRSGG